MEASQANLKVSFYLKKNVSRKGLCPVMGRIAIGKEKVQFSCKLEADPKLWDTRAGRVNGKSAHAHSVNREIDKIIVAVNAGYREIVSIRGHATAGEVKGAFQGIHQFKKLKLFFTTLSEKSKKNKYFCVSQWQDVTLSKVDNRSLNINRYLTFVIH